MTAQEIMKVMEENKGQFSVFGIRGDDIDMKIGEYFQFSHDMVYEDYYGEEKLLDGSCAIGIEDPDEDDIQNALDHITKTYLYKHLYVVAGDDYDYGNDDGEFIINNCNGENGAVVLAVIK